MSELLIGLRFSMEDRCGAAKDAQESYNGTDFLDLQKKVCLFFYYFSLLETI
jgi:hypothetical protein